MRRLALLVAVVALAGASTAGSTPNPSSVTIAGDLQRELGCGGDWDPGCAATHLTYDAGDDVWQGTWTVPAGTWQYKAALNNSWDENYGAHAVPGGDNVTLNLGSSTPVKFYYDHKSHWITDNHSSVIATVPGSFQHELGCAGDWDPGCLRSWLQDPDGDGIYTFVTTALTRGSYEAKVALNESWDVNYGQGGVPGGANIPFTVPVDGAKVTFSYNSTTHVLTILSGHAQDNNVEWDGLRHDSRDTLYRTPGGAVQAGSSVKIRFRTFHDDVSSVKMRVFDVNTSTQTIVPMTRAASDVSCYQASLASESCDFWQATVTRAQPDNLWYRFIVTDGTSTAYYADDTTALDGGLGAPTDSPVDNSYALMFYDPGFTTPSWVKDAVMYQIFPDRFRNGDKKNDPKTGDVRYDDPVLALPWGTKPEGYCHAYADAATNCPWRFDLHPPSSPTVESPRGRDYMGGDLKGITDKLDYLKTLGVNTLYLNPIFWAKSNHRYDTADYTKIDPYLGTEADFKTLTREAGKRGMRVILDGVFNHMSSDSAFFDRYHHYDSVGACESLTSQWRSWFTFTTSNVPCGASDYTGWAGFDSIPVLNKSNPAVQSYFVGSGPGPKSIAVRWLDSGDNKGPVDGASGWRLDVMGDPSFPDGYWETFRQTVKSYNPNAVIIGELWQKDSTLLRFLRGDRADSTMNYRLRDAVLSLLVPPGQTFDGKGFGDSGNQLSVSAAAARLASIWEDYPRQVGYSLMDLLDSHDTARLLWQLTPGDATTAAKENNATNLAEGKTRLDLASLLQFGVPGAPTVYYGDEVGVTGADDPDDRRTYPWPDTGGNPDMSLYDHYKLLASIRHDVPALTDGDFRILLTDNTAQTLAFGRRTTSSAAIVAVNRSGSSQTIDIPVGGYLPDGTSLAWRYGGSGDVSVSGGNVHITLGPLSGALLATANGVDLAPPAAPSGLKVTNEGNATVSLSWTAVAGAASYAVYRSPLSGGGYVKAGTPTATTFDDSGLRNARQYYYVVRALDSAGNESGDSNEVSALPHLTIGWANLQWPPTLTHTISAVNRTDNVYGQVYIDGVTNQPGATDTLRAQLGWGPDGSNPAGNSAWSWVDASFNTDAGNNDEFVATLLPDAVGRFDYAYRYTTTDGRDWLYADLDGIGNGYSAAQAGDLTVNASGDTTAPAVPSGLRVTGSSPSEIDLAWDAVTGDPSLYGYEILRDGVQVARVTGTTFADTSVDEGQTYSYSVRSVDTSFNRSQPSASVSAKAQQRIVDVTFVATVPASTDGTGRAVHIAGTLSLLNDNLNDWDPGQAKATLTRTDATHWRITLHGFEGTQLQYKYVLGDWNYVEKDASCGEIANRTLTLAYGAGGTQTVNDTVSNWRNVAPCGN